MTQIKRHHVLALFLVAGAVATFSVVASQSPPASLAFAATCVPTSSGDHTVAFATPGTCQYTIPSYGTLTVQVWGGGGSGGTEYNQGGDGTNSSFDTSVIAGKGLGGRGGAAGAGGAASGGDTNTSGNSGGTVDLFAPTAQPGGLAPNGGAGGPGNQICNEYDLSGSVCISFPAGFPGSVPGGGGGGTYNAGGGGSGAYVSKQYSSGTLTVGSDISIVVGSGGTDPIGGGSGASGKVSITWTDFPTPPLPSAPTCTLSPASQDIIGGNSATLNYTITGSATTATINSVSVPTSASGSYSPSPAATTNYTMTVTNADGSSVCGPVTVTVTNPVGPLCDVTLGGDAITGYAWSDTIGWIDLNCSNTGTCGTSNFGMSIDPSGDISGCGWSEHIGWVSASPAALSGCPLGSCSASLTSGGMSGWMKALAGGSSESGGWDGWISLSGSSPNYGVTKNDDGTFSGFAWGSTVVGWIGWSLAQTSYTVCTPTSTFTCTGPGNQTIRRTDVSAQCITTITDGATCVSPQFCSNGSVTCLDPIPPIPTFIPFDDDRGTQQSGHLNLRPILVRRGSPAWLYWDIGNVSTCSVHGTNGQNWIDTLSSGASGQITAGIQQRTTFTLTCVALDGSSITESKSVNIIPTFFET